MLLRSLFSLLLLYQSALHFGRLECQQLDFTQLNEFQYIVINSSKTVTPIPVSHPKNKMSNSSLGYEILLYLNKYFFLFFAISEFGIIIFKLIHLPYPSGILISEFLILIFLCSTEAVRIFMGHKGNLTEKTFPIVMSITLTVPAVLGTIYFLIWQTYVLWIELILCGIELTLQGLELGFAILCLLRFFRTVTY